MVIESYNILQTDPAIIEVYFKPFPDDVVDQIYAEDKFIPLSFTNLILEAGRYQYTTKDEYSDNWQFVYKYFTSAYKDITKIFLELDRKRYPVMWDEGNKKTNDQLFDAWYINNNLEKQQYFSICRDTKGFQQGQHLDNRLTIWAGIVNLKDNSTGTCHWSEKAPFGQDAFRIPHYFQASGKKMVGTFWINTEYTWHGVRPIEEDRYIALCNQMLVGTWTE